MGKSKQKGTFISGMLTGAILLGCGTAALAAGGTVSFGTMGLTGVMGQTVVKAGEPLTNASGQEIPATIIYTDSAGGGNTYVPIRVVSELVDLPVDWEQDMIYLGGKSVDPVVSVGGDPAPAEGIQVGAKAGPYTEVAPYWPAQEEITTSYDLNSHIISTSGAAGSGAAESRGGYLSLSVTNNTKYNLRLSARSPRAITGLFDRFSSVAIAPGETVIRTFKAEQYTGYLYQRDIAYEVNFDSVDRPDGDTPVDVTVSCVTFQR